MRVAAREHAPHQRVRAHPGDRGGDLAESAGVIDGVPQGQADAGEGVICALVGLVPSINGAAISAQAMALTRDARPRRYLATSPGTRT